MDSFKNVAHTNIYKKIRTYKNANTQMYICIGKYESINSQTYIYTYMQVYKFTC